MDSVTFIKGNVMEKNENTLISSKQKKAVKVVEKLLTAMHHDIKELNKIEDIEDNLETIQKKAVRISKICIVLQNSLDLKHGGEVASNLNHLYQTSQDLIYPIHFALFFLRFHFLKDLILH